MSRVAPVTLSTAGRPREARSTRRSAAASRNEEGVELAAGDEDVVPSGRLELLRDFYAFVEEGQRESLEAWRARKRDDEREDRGG